MKVQGPVVVCLFKGKGFNQKNRRDRLASVPDIHVTIILRGGTGSPRKRRLCSPGQCEEHG